MSISVFFPAYNEETNIEKTVRQAQSVLERLQLDYEIIIINDGSVDRTGEIGTQLAQENDRIKLINHPENRGYGGALITGLYSSKKEWVCFTDSDGQYDFNNLEKFLEKRDQADLIIGYRAKRADGFIRKLNASLFNLEMRLLFGLKIKDIDCGFKLIKKEVLDHIPHLECDGAMIEAELLIRAQKKGYQISQVPVEHLPRQSGQQTGANLRVIWKGAVLEPLQLFTSLRKKS